MDRSNSFLNPITLANRSKPILCLETFGRLSRSRICLHLLVTSIMRTTTYKFHAQPEVNCTIVTI